MSSTPRAKRQFAGASSDPSQRQITSFFPTSASTSGPSPAAAQTTYAPVLPSSIQSSLINVGMRIRKSVPEGYKTGSPHSAFKLWDEGSGGRDNSPAVRTGARTARRRGGAPGGELVPFCGVHSVGGMAVQPVHYLEEDAGAGEMDIPGLTSSQETVDGDDFENPRKRGHADEEEEELGFSFDFWDGKVMTAATSGNARAMALPRGRRKGGAGTGPFKQGRGQENCVDDFEEADFLDEKVFGADFAMSDA